MALSLKKMNINTTDELIHYYPYRYNYYEIKNLSKDLEESSGCIRVYKAKVLKDPVVNYIKKNFNRMSFLCESNNLVFKVYIFNRAFQKNNLKVGKEIFLIGKYNMDSNTFLASDIKFVIPDNFIEPVYHVKDKITNTILKKLMGEVDFKNIEGVIPNYLEEKYEFCSESAALKKIHFPHSLEDVKIARKRLVYEELFVFMFKILSFKVQNENASKIGKNINNEEIKKFIEKLPFKLTSDQLKAIEDIINDMKSEKRMNRLVIGDVGSGKTIVAVIGILANYLAGYQSAFMAPTEVLALQHFSSIKKLLGNIMNIDILVGSMKKSEKENVIERLANGEIDLIIGTHALIEEKVKIKNLGLVITDEQHRFGVNQRKYLQEKGKSSDCLYLSATPIPRTLALTIYGDLDVSCIKEKPVGRKEIKTKVVPLKDLKEVLKKMYEELKNGHQVFVVSPLINNDDENDEIKSVYVLQDKLNIAFNGKYNISVLHGKLPSNEKQAIMNDFKNGVINILISTTVIEVGVDVENATMMVIFNAERFGLATIHQLRGRVGRNDLECSCYLICNSDILRLKVLEESNDGFYISEKDLEMRREGDFFGTRQSGVMTFKIANIYRDKKTLLYAKNDALDFISNNLYKKYQFYLDIKNNINIID